MTLDVQPPGGRSLSLCFHYLPALELVTVSCMEAADHTILAALFPDDNGSCVPFEEAHLRARGGAATLDLNRPDRPYRFSGISVHIFHALFVPHELGIFCMIGVSCYFLVIWKYS